ncbi:MAG TPA: alpha/beta fold hydrolase [Acidimicrobiia bacterium]|nr:alpha/beta fold hydrolase [Acidimicrobiia bacterium]
MSIVRRWLASVSVILAMVTGALIVPSSAASPTADRPYGLKVPEGSDGARALPLVVLLHGYTSNGERQAGYFGLPALADRAGFLLATPNGTRDRMGNRFWNATDACCDWFRTGVDDVAYLDAMIDEIAAEHPVDPARVFVVGHSNGAFMAHRYACDRSNRVAAIVTLAGMQWKDQANCKPESAVSVLQVHGRNDMTVRYEGGYTPAGAYPGAVETVAAWAAHTGCTGELAATGRTLDVDQSVPGAETVEEARSGCPSGIAAALWTIEGGGHVPPFNENWAAAIWSFMSTHPKVS